MIERRKLERLQLRCPISLWRPADGTFSRTVTENLSSEGFYCLCHEPYRLGDELEATLEILTQHTEPRRADSLALQCRVEVVRTEVHGTKCGLACRIKEYIAI